MHSTPDFDSDDPDVQAFWSNVAMPAEDNPDGCALYVGPGTREASGHIRISFKGQRDYASRVAYRLVHGDLEAGCALHICRNPPCCRVWGRDGGHIVDGDRLLNAIHRDVLHNSRTPFLPRGSAHWSARLTDREVQAILTARELGIPVKKIARMFDISASTTYALLAGTTGYLRTATPAQT